MELHTLKFEVDGASAAAGVKQFSTAIDQAIRSADKFDSRMTDAFSRLSTVTSKGFSSLARDLSKLNGVSIDPALASSVDRLATAVKGFKGPTPASVANFSALSKAFASLSIGAASTKRLAEISAALSSFKAPSASSLSGIRAFLREVASFKVPKDFKSFAAVLNSITASANRSATALRSLNSAANSGGISNINKHLNQANNSMAGTASSALNLRTALQAIGIASAAAGMMSFANAAFSAEASMVKFRATMLAATGSMSGVAKELGFVRGLADELGVPLQQTGEKFAKFAIASDNAGVSMAESERIFRSMSIALTATGASASDADLAFLALEQMMSKGVVSAEELRRQLSERIPGAFGMMAEAIGVSTAKLDKMLRLGQVMSADALPKLATVMEKRFGAGLTEALGGPVVALNRLKNAVFDMFNTFNQGGFINALTEQMNALAFSMSQPQFKAFVADMGYLAGILVNTLATGVRIVVDNIYLFANAAGILIAMKLKDYFMMFAQSVNFSSTALATNTVQMQSNTMAARMFGVSLVQTNTFSGILTGGFRKLTASIGAMTRGLMTALGPVGLFVAAYTVFVQIFRAGGLAAIDFARSIGVLSQKQITAAQSQTLLNTAMNNGTLTQENAKRLHDAINESLTFQKTKIDAAVDSITTYRSVWTGWLLNHKAELDATSKSLVDLANRFKSGSMTTTEFATALAKVPMNDASASAKDLSTKLIEIAAESVKLNGSQKELAVSIQQFRAEALAAGEDTATYDKILKELIVTFNKAAGAQDDFSKKTKDSRDSIKSIKQQIAEANNVYSTVPSYLRNISNVSVGTSSAFSTMGNSAINASQDVDNLTSSMNQYVQAANQASSVGMLDPTGSSSSSSSAFTRRSSSNGSGEIHTKRGQVILTGYKKLSDTMADELKGILDSIGGTVNYSRTGRNVTDPIINVPDEYKSLLKFNALDIVQGFSGEASAFLRNYKAMIAKKEADSSSESSSSSWDGVMGSLSSGMGGLSSALGANTSALTGLNSGLETSLGLIFNRLDLARRNVSGMYNDPAALFNSGAGSYRDIHGFADGGEFTVGGRGGTDKNLVPLRLTRGEKVRITPKGEESQGGVNIQGIHIHTQDYDSFRRNKAQFAREMATLVKSATSGGRIN